MKHLGGLLFDANALTAHIPLPGRAIGTGKQQGLPYDSLPPTVSRLISEMTSMISIRGSVLQRQRGKAVRVYY